jgi:hypothetical protein
MTTELTQSERAAYIDQLAGTIEYSVWDDDRWSIISDHALITMMEMLLEREASEPEYLAWLAAHSGMTIDEVRRLDDEERVELQLTAEAAEAAKTAEMSTWPAAPVTPVPAVGYQPLELVCADDIEDTIPTWAWGFDGHGRILNAALTLFGDDPKRASPQQAAGSPQDGPTEPCQAALKATPSTSPTLRQKRLGITPLSPRCGPPTPT